MNKDRQYEEDCPCPDTKPLPTESGPPKTRENNTAEPRSVEELEWLWNPLNPNRPPQITFTREELDAAAAAFQRLKANDGAAGRKGPDGEKARPNFTKSRCKCGHAGKNG
jgi:hypothetical protein